MATTKKIISKRKKGLIKKTTQTEVLRVTEKTPPTSKSRGLNIKLLLIILTLALIFYFSKSIFVAAVVDGRPIFRWSVNKILEEQGGTQTLDFLIIEKLVSTEAQKRKIDVKKTVEDQIKSESETISAQGSSFDEWLTYQGYTRTLYEKELKIRKEAEEILKEKLLVSDEEIQAYLEQNKSLYENTENTEELKDEIRNTIKAQKFNEEFMKWIEEAKTESNILYLTNFSGTVK